jgi:hypothetical protein
VATCKSGSSFRNRSRRRVGTGLKQDFWGRHEPKSRGPPRFFQELLIQAARRRARRLYCCCHEAKSGAACCALRCDCLGAERCMPGGSSAGAEILGRFSGPSLRDPRASANFSHRLPASLSSEAPADFRLRDEASIERRVETWKPARARASAGANFPPPQENVRVVRWPGSGGEWSGQWCATVVPQEQGRPATLASDCYLWPACPGPLAGRPLSASSEWPGRDAAGARAATAWDGLQPHINNFAARSLGRSPGQSPSHGPGLGRGCWLDGEGETVRARWRKFGWTTRASDPMPAARGACLPPSVPTAAKVRGSVQQLPPSSASHLISDKTLRSLFSLIPCCCVSIVPQ